MSLSQIYSPPPILLTHCMALRLLHFILFYYLWAIFCPFWIICVKAIVVKSSESITRLLLLLLLSRFSCVWLCATPWRQPIRLHRPWDFLGKNTGVGCHFLLQCMKVKSESEVAQSCPTLSNPTDGSPPGSSVHGIFQARVLEWGVIAFSDFHGSNPGSVSTSSGYLSKLFNIFGL